MALASRKSGAIHSKTGSDLDNLKAKYDNNKHTELEVFEGEAALIYQMQLLKEDIDELRRYITSEVGDGAKGDNGDNHAAGPQGTAGNKGRDGSDGSDGATHAMTDLSENRVQTSRRGLAAVKRYNARGIGKIAYK